MKLNKKPIESEIPGALTLDISDDEIMDIPTNPAVLKAMHSVLKDLKALPQIEQEERILSTPPEDVTIFLSEWAPLELSAMFAHRIRRAAGIETGTVQVLVQKLMEAEKYEEAKIPAKYLMEKGDHVGYSAYARILTGEDKADEGIIILRKGLDEGIKFPPRQYVSILIACGFYQEAIVESLELLEKEPALAFSLFYCYDRLEQKENAAKAFRQAIKLNNLGESISLVRKLTLEEHYEEAKKLLVKVLKTYMSGYHIPEERIEQMGERLLSGLHALKSAPASSREES